MVAALQLENNPLFETDFYKEMLRQIKFLDTSGHFDGLPAEVILKEFIRTPERKTEIPLVGNPDPATITRVNTYYNTIAMLVEQNCGLFPVSLVNLSPEGFGRALITVGKLVVVDKTLRDMHRFGFKDFLHMKSEADKLVSKAIELINKYQDVAEL